MKITFNTLFVSLFLLISACSPLPDEVLLEVMNELKTNFAPDSRVAIWDIQYEQKGRKLIFSGESNLPEAVSELKRKLSQYDKKVCYEIQSLPAASFGDTVYGIVNASIANFRGEPRHSAELITQAILGHPLRLYKTNQSGYWYYLQSSDNYLGWLESGAFVRLSKNDFEHWQKSEKVIYLQDAGSVYSKPNQRSSLVSDLVAGALLKYEGENGSYYKVRYPDGRSGYIPKHNSALFSKWLAGAEASEESIIKTSYRYMGIPYLWGGTSSKAMDCSGFTKTIYFLNGILLPRDASQQVHKGQKITEDVNRLDLLRPGDLLFFGRKATADKAERVTHVGIYIGNGEMIHETGPVCIESLQPGAENFTQYRYNTFIRAKRIIGQAVTQLSESPWYNQQNK
ncbi:MAG TPA: glycoside hydrolase [Candidatus Marinimicrobia bacterium]|nr:glycoside hydrolase [Candidatus Neomarinimicrobiota bacterium]